MKKFFGAFLIAIMGGATSLGVYKWIQPEVQDPITYHQENDSKLVGLINSEPMMGVDYMTAAEMTVNGVVHVKTEGIVEYQQRGYDPFREFFYGNGNYHKKYQQPIKGAGSGVIISADGYLVTNNHVVENADQIKVTLNNRKTYSAELIGTDPTTDLALLKIEEENLPFISYGNSDQIRVGEWVLAVGNPFNLTSTVTAGIVSAKGRDINILGNDPMSGLPSIESFIQTDAAVNPGNSGGALVNTIGELIGINAAIKSNTGSFAGYSFAIPSNIVKKVVSDLREFGTVQRAFIGINIRNIDENLAEEIGIDDYSGVYVVGLAKFGSAKEAGIQEGDIIKSIEGISVSTVTELQAKVGEYRPGDKINVSLIREGKRLEKEVTLKNLEGNTAIISSGKTDLMKKLGAKFIAVDTELLAKLAIQGGIQVEQLFNGKLKQAGVLEGFIITKVDNNDVENIDEFYELLKEKKGGVLLQGFYPNGRESYYGIGM